ncbi:TonB-dependent receptor [Longimicrobium sp.]|uniref:TonB-dependent receptor n=1 Tax=Longimicrobium sp. TaxID=2029185 RepID=UPI002E3497E2|nr:TonB-dependent receptor [Longimicrobium sp.]HEX6042523.1 TonB-dependent receptor [Longimicrobium sp.]
MSSSGTPRPRWRTLLAALAMALVPALAHAQVGTVRGTVAGTGGEALAGARVSVAGTRLSTTTDAMGAFVLRGVGTGTQSFRVSHVGYRDLLREVVVRPGEETLVAFQLEDKPFELDAMVVSASRTSERVTEAPATITRIGPEILDASVGNTFAGALKEVKGLDFVQVGMTSVGVNARGFNSSFNNRMLMVEDGRVMVLPENGLPVGQFTATPKVDLAGIEVLVGPGAALYGADASSGVISMETKDPRAFPGLTVEVTGGNRAYRDVQARYAGVVGEEWGYKVSGEYQEANDWSNRLTLVGSTAREYRAGDAPTAAIMPEVGREGAPGLDWDASVMRGTGAIARYLGSGKLELSGGASVTDGVGQTNVGRNQLVNWGYNFQQLRFSSTHWYANVYRSQSKSGDSWATNRYTQAYYPNLARPDATRLTDDQLVAASDWPSNGRMYAGEVQYNSRLPFFLNSALVLGTSYRQDVVSSDRQWLSDRLSEEDISVGQFGTYGQLTAPVMPWLDVVLAGRFDTHENYESQFSPKAGVVVRPIEGQNFRVTYNRAFKSPTILQTSFFIPDWNAATSVYGNTDGFTVRRPNGDVLRTYAPLAPEQNTTWEFGYKGVLWDRVFLDVAHYRSEYENFMSPLAIINDPFGGVLAGDPAGNPTYAFDGAGNRLNNIGGTAPAYVLTYWNLGRAKINGTDLGLNVVVTPKISLRSTLSTIDISDVEVDAGREESTALNSPELKWTLGASFQDFGRLTGGLSVRHVDEYYFRSGVNRGFIPGFSTVDATMGYRLDRFNTMLTLGVSNLFSCGGRFEYADTDVLRATPTHEDRACGFGEKHVEMINMPEIGTMVFLGVRYQTR